MLQESDPSKWLKLRRFGRRPSPGASPTAAALLPLHLLGVLLQRVRERVDVAGLERGHHVVGAGLEVVAIAIGLLLLAAVAVVLVGRGLLVVPIVLFGTVVLAA